MKNCKWCNKEYDNGLKLAGHQTWCVKNPNISKTKAKISINSKKLKHIQETKDKISKIRKKYLMLNSNIDFSKFGWVKQVSFIINIHSSKVSQFMKKYMFDFYINNCFRRK